MPEIPEVIHHAQRLSNLLKGKKLESIVIHRGPYSTSEKEKYSKFRGLVSNYEPHYVKDIKTKGKYMYFLLEGEEHHALGFHHGMEGSWCDEPTNNHIILELKYWNDKKKLKYSESSKVSNKPSTRSVFFQDSRRFGTFEFLSEEMLEQKLKKIGYDVFYDIRNYIEFWTLIETTTRIKNKRLCEVLMDQSFISGIGNYLRADIMYEAKIDPRRLIKNLSGKEIENLFSAIKKIVKKSCESGATTTGNYNSSIHSGSYDFLIYGKKRCPNGGKVECFKDKQKRTVWWVPTQQK